MTQIQTPERKRSFSFNFNSTDRPKRRRKSVRSLDDFPISENATHSTVSQNSQKKKHWWECCLKKKIEQQLESYDTSTSNFENYGHADDAMSCLCFSCDKCLKALENARIEEQNQHADIIPLEFITQFDGGQENYFQDVLSRPN